MGATPTTYRGEDAAIRIKGHTDGKAHGVIGLSDFSLTLDRGTVEQELVGEAGNYFVAGSLSVEGSLTACKLDSTAAGDILVHVISGTRAWVSGNCGTNSLSFFFASCMITGFDLSMGDADTITEGSIDFAVEDPQNVKIINLDTGNTQIKDT
jgi:hypothetical protein